MNNPFWHDGAAVLFGLPYPGVILAKEEPDQMGLFDIAESMLTSALAGGTLGTGQAGGLNTQQVLGAVMGALNNHPGGLGGVVQSLSQNGLADVVTSWIGNGPNPPVTSGQIQGALGSGPINEIAGKLGISPEMAGTVLSQVLPHIVDHLTPNGQVPQSGLSGAGSSLLQSILGGSFGNVMGAGR
jgi:uncharacterized protein YidB (DUF937 family)